MMLSFKIFSHISGKSVTISIRIRCLPGVYGHGLRAVAENTRNGLYKQLSAFNVRLRDHGVHGGEQKFLARAVYNAVHVVRTGLENVLHRAVFRARCVIDDMKADEIFTK